MEGLICFTSQRNCQHCVRLSLVPVRIRASADQYCEDDRTGDNSYRWQNSGGFAIAKGGKVEWVHEAIHAGDTCDYAAAVKSIIG